MNYAGMLAWGRPSASCADCTGCPNQSACENGAAKGSCKWSGPNPKTGVCVNLDTDITNCGALGHACTGGQTCISGICTCPNGGTDLLSDVNNCGACGKACPASSTCSNGACCMPAAPLANGGFEAGFDGFVISTQASPISGTWYLQAGTTAPLNQHFVVAPPPQGSAAAMTDQDGPGSYQLYFSYHINGPGEVLSFKYFINNQAITFATPSSFDFNRGNAVPNQQALVFVTTGNPAVYPDADHLVTARMQGIRLLRAAT
ncbi:hypothetical protein WJX72_005081 [[Myrmecia] bisecta]|uniref:Tryptophan synthase alpha chain n=1 Tax=[Myrmecia] bisecta TaxID=41462 RepID=A0AAW1QQI5_9CHLO